MEYVEPIRDRAKIESMKRYLKGKNLRDYALFTLGINSGLRISDLLSLTVLQVTDKRGRITDRLEIREQKTEKIKEFPVGSTARKALEEYLTSSAPTD